MQNSEEVGVEKFLQRVKTCQSDKKGDYSAGMEMGMGVFDSIRRRQGEVVDSWVRELTGNKASHYAKESESDLKPLVNLAVEAFCGVLEGGDWDDLNAFITMIAQKRLLQGFKLSEVQEAFMLFQRVVTPIIISESKGGAATEELLEVSNCMSKTIAVFSDYFQGLHEAFMREQTVTLEREVARRTRQLLDSEKKYKSLVEDIRDGYFVIDSSIVIYANKAFCSMHGRTMQETVGLPFLELVAPEFRNLVKSSLESNRLEKKSGLLEYLRLSRDGRTHPTETHARFSFFEGKEAGLGICRDISERRELERKTREAETLNALAQQAASLAHDIRNPLTAIKMNVQMLSAEFQDNTTHGRLLEISQKEIASIERSMEDMMDLARPFRLSREPVQLRMFIEGCIESLRSRMEQKKIKASVSLDPELNLVNMDPHKMEQAIVNLLFNSIEATSIGGHIIVSTEVEDRAGKKWAGFCVSDDGRGIPDELMPYVFDEKHNKRIGMGLDNVKRVAKAHGGTLEVSHRIPRGLQVWLRLPLDHSA